MVFGLSDVALDVATDRLAQPGDEDLRRTLDKNPATSLTVISA
jgi:hypothetical protein